MPTPSLKLFGLDDILSITTGRLVSSRHMTGVYEILNWMTQSNLFTHQIPQAFEVCAPILCALYPSLAPGPLARELHALDQQLADTSRDEAHARCARWVETLSLQYGAVLPVPSTAQFVEAFSTPVADALQQLRPDQ